MMRHLHTKTAHDTNKELVQHLFSNDSNYTLQLTGEWTMSDRQGSDFMKRHGYSVLSDSIKAYLGGQFTTHRYLHPRVSNAQDGISTMNGEDCECLRQITSAKTSGAKHVMVLRAVRQKVLSPEVIQFACGAQRPVRPLAPDLQRPTSENKEDGIEVMLVEADDGQKDAKGPKIYAKLCQITTKCPPLQVKRCVRT